MSTDTYVKLREITCGIVKHSSGQYHLFPFFPGVFTADRLSGHGQRRLFVCGPVDEDGLSPPADLQVVLPAPLDPVREVLQRAVVEVVPGSQRLGIDKGGPALEGLVGAPDVVVHV